MGVLSVIGGPLTMAFVVLETTGDLWLTTAVMIAVIVSAQVTRETFGRSFATWRFHLRGESIRSAARWDTRMQNATTAASDGATRIALLNNRRD
jgi:H+/Cl- antiporter ClcA